MRNLLSIVYQISTQILLSGKKQVFFSKKLLFSRFRTDIEYNGTHWVHRNSKLAQMEDFWCPGNPSVNNYVAMNKDGNLALYDKTFLLSPNFCVRRLKQIEWPKNLNIQALFAILENFAGNKMTCSVAKPQLILNEKSYFNLKLWKIPDR